MNKMERTPFKTIKILQNALEEIKELDPTRNEIEKFAEDALAGNSWYGLVSYTASKYYFGPRLHNTWGIKFGGHVRIDIGCCGYHLMLDKKTAWDFIEFIKSERKSE